MPSLRSRLPYALALSALLGGCSTDASPAAMTAPPAPQPPAATSMSGAAANAMPKPATPPSMNPAMASAGAPAPATPAAPPALPATPNPAVDPEGDGTKPSDMPPAAEPAPLSVAGARCPEGPFGNPLEGISAPRRVMSGYTFTEGAVWVESTQSFYFTEIDRPAITGRIHKYTPGTGEVGLFTDDVAANGLAVDQNGMIIAGAQDLQQLSRVDPVTGERSEVPGGTKYMDVVYNSPNDIVVRSDGNIYFTDSEYQRGGRPAQYPILGVYWINPEGVTTRFDMRNAPNGINLSPDTKFLYVSITDGGAPMNRYPIGPDGKPGAGESFISPNSDGMAMDCGGNLYLTQPFGAGSPVLVYSAAGMRLGSVGPFGSGTFNVAFGGDDGKLMLVCSGNSIYEVDMTVPGMPN